MLIPSFDPYARRIAVLDAPSNLGLRPPLPGVVPGVYKLAGALRDHGLLARLDARDAGVATPPRYSSELRAGEGTRNEAAIARYTPRLADRIEKLLGDGEFPVVLGGDCSILLGGLLALRRRGRFGLAYLDGHLDFRHPGNAAELDASAGEDLALVTGRGGALAELEGLRPLVREQDVLAIGARADDQDLAEAMAAGIAVATEADVRANGPRRTGEQAARRLGAVDGFWVHLDADIIDPETMPAVDSPDPGGLGLAEVAALLRPLLASPRAVGLEVTILDPDLDEDGTLAGRFADLIVDALRPS
jgi:arginase